MSKVSQAYTRAEEYARVMAKIEQDRKKRTREILLSYRRELCHEMAILHEKLGRTGLHKTFQKMKPALDAIGFEVAELEESGR